jgi:GTPase SAR1 family protein
MDESIITSLNKIQEIFIKHKMSDEVEFPQIVVIGSQSCGKSSLLDLIVGEDFLPKGENIMTRTPILIQSTTNKSLKHARARLGHLKDKIFEDFGKLKDEINLQTERLAGKAKGVTAEPIVVKIEGPNCCTLSCVDLPGLTKIPVNGQPEDIETQIQELSQKFIENPNSIILALSAANNDIANSESLKLAMKIDQELERTLCVITKTDLYSGSNKHLEQLFKGKVLNLRHGFIAVSCVESKFANEHHLLSEKYPILNKETFGRELLIRKLNQLLTKKLSDNVPTLRQKLHSILKVA